MVMRLVLEENYVCRPQNVFSCTLLPIRHTNKKLRTAHTRAHTHIHTHRQKAHRTLRDSKSIFCSVGSGNQGAAHLVAPPRYGVL